MAATKVTLKLLIDQTGKRVLFAEAGKDFVDFLFSILALPVGSVTRLLSAKKMVGCLGNLYKSIQDLNSTYLQPNISKDSVLNPIATFCGGHSILQLIDIVSSSPATSFYKCPNYNYNCRLYVADDPNSICPCCKHLMNFKVTYVHPPAPTRPVSSSYTTTGDGGGYVKGVVTYMIMDNLVVNAMSTISSITLLSQFHVKDLGCLQEKVVELGVKEALEILGASLKSKTVLTDVFIRKK